MHNLSFKILSQNIIFMYPSLTFLKRYLQSTSLSKVIVLKILQRLNFIISYRAIDAYVQRQYQQRSINY